MSSTPTAILLAVGNELLNGEVRDSNLFNLIRRLTQVGVQVEHVAMVRDDVQRIATSVCELLDQHPDLLIISGGLGPTADDLTLEAVAHALDLPMTENAEARALVEQQYDQLLEKGYLPKLGPEPARRKMSTLPAGTRPLHNPIGTAPAVQFTHQKTLIYCLPGVPAELEAIFTGSVVPELRRRFATGSWVEKSITVQCEDEANVAGILQQITDRHPETYVKSLARPFPDASSAELHIVVAARAPGMSEAQQTVHATLADLRELLKKEGLPIIQSTRKRAGDNHEP